jgi:hypothetical protein
MYIVAVEKCLRQWVKARAPEDVQASGVLADLDRWSRARPSCCRNPDPSVIQSSTLVREQRPASTPAMVDDSLLPPDPTAPD